MQSEKDRPIKDVIEGIKRDLRNFGFSNPVIYHVSARKGLWAKLCFYLKLGQRGHDIVHNPSRQDIGSWQLLVISVGEGRRQRAEGRSRKSERYN